MIRVLTAGVLLLILAGSLMFGESAFALVMAVGFGACLYEWLRIGGLGARPALLVSAIEMITQFSIYWAGGIERVMGFLLVLTGVVTLAWIVILGVELTHRFKGFRVTPMTCLLAAVTFVPAAYLSLLYLLHQGGWVLVFSVLLVVWGADISAYFCGRAWGRHPLAPAMSPKKTLEGALGAYGIVIVFFALTYIFCIEPMVFSTYVFNAYGWAFGLGFLAFLVALSIAGDLWESMLKRLVGIKDSSNLLPGHGGFFDRLDAMLPVLPAAAFLMLYTELLT